MSRGPVSVAALALALASCGYVGDPLAPSLNIPQPVRDLSVAERGDQIEVRFTTPEQTTDGVRLREFQGIELDASGQTFEIPPAVPGKTVLQTYPAVDFAGRTVRFQVRTASPQGKWSPWSNPIEVAVVQPLAAPTALAAVSAPGGVRVTWKSDAPVSIRRKSASEAEPAVVAESQMGGEWLDTGVQMGVAYEYSAQAVSGEARSAWTASVAVTPADTFPPSPPTGVTAIASIGSIELTWNRSPEPDTAGYRVFRAPAGSDAFEQVGDFAPTPAFSDRAVTAGETYRYRVAAVDQRGNQSAPSEPAEATAPQQ